MASQRGGRAPGAPERLRDVPMGGPSSTESRNREGSIEMRVRRLPSFAVLVSGVALALFAAVPTTSRGAGKFRIENPWVRCSPNATSSRDNREGDCAVYLTISNETAADDALVAAMSPAARAAALHQATSTGSTTSMQVIEKFDIPAGGRLELKPGRYHIMLIGLTRALKPGDRITIGVTLQKGGPLTFEAPVQ